MKRKLVFLLSLIFLLTLTADAFASASCKTRSRCRWWAKKYVAKATVRCLFNPIPLCHSRGSSCGTAYANCGWKYCLVGGASANASNGPGGCFKSGSRTGLGRYGEPSATTTASEDNAGAHDMQSYVEFVEQQGAVVRLDSLVMSSTLDESFSRLDVTAYVESEEGLANDDDDFPPDRIVWQGYIHLQKGVVTQQGFDEEVQQYLGRVDVTEVIFPPGVFKEIPFIGTADEFDRLAVDVVIDGGQSETAP